MVAEQLSKQPVRSHGGLRYRPVGGRIYEATPDPDGPVAARYYLMDGTNVQTLHDIPRDFRLVRAEFKHVDSSEDDTTGALNVDVEVQNPDSTLYHSLVADSVTSSTTVYDFGESWEFFARRMRVTLNALSTDRVFPIYTFQWMR